MALNLKAIKEQEEQMEAENKGTSNFLFAGKLSEEEPVRILPPTEQMNGVYFIRQKGWWIDKRFYPLPLEFSEDGYDPIEDEIERLKIEGTAEEREDYKALLSAKDAKGMPLVKQEERLLIPILHLVVDEENELVEVIDEQPKLLVAKYTLFEAINQLVVNRQYFKHDKENGITSREHGFNLFLGKRGKGLDTKYSAIPFSFPEEMPEEYYEGGEKFTNLYEYILKGERHEDYYTDAISAYLLGTEKPDYEDYEPLHAELHEKADEVEDEKPKRTTKASKRTSKRTARSTTKTASKKRSSRKKMSKDEVEDEEGISEVLGTDLEGLEGV